MSNGHTPQPPSGALVSAWNHQRRASIAAGNVKTSYYSWHKILLVLAISVAFMETLSGQLANQNLGRVIAGVGALLIAIVPVIGSFKTGSEKLRQWIMARSVSEELKAEVFRYLLRCGNYATGVPESKLVEATDQLLENLDASLVAGIKPDDQAPPDVHDVDGFISARVDDQIRYYRSAAEREGRVVSRNRNAQFVLAGVAALIGGASAFLDELTIGAWVAVVIAIGASIAAHVAAGRHEHLVLSYTSTARRLESLKNCWLADPQADPCPFVAECEAAISSQNEGWMAEFMKAN